MEGVQQICLFNSFGKLLLCDFCRAISTITFFSHNHFFSIRLYTGNGGKNDPIQFIFGRIRPCTNKRQCTRFRRNILKLVICRVNTITRRRTSVGQTILNMFTNAFWIDRYKRKRWFHFICSFA